MPRSRAFKVSVAFLASAILCLFVADLSVSTQYPWAELWRIGRGFLTPNFLAVRTLAEALSQTLAFALFGVGVGAAGGFALALVFDRWPVRWIASFLRS